MARQLHSKPQLRLDRALFKARSGESLLIIGYALCLFLLPLALFVWVANTAATLWCCCARPFGCWPGTGGFCKRSSGMKVSTST